MKSYPSEANFDNDFRGKYKQVLYKMERNKKLTPDEEAMFDTVFTLVKHGDLPVSWGDPRKIKMDGMK